MIHQCMLKWQWEHDSSSLEYDRPQLEQTTVSSMYFPVDRWIKTKVFSANQPTQALIQKHDIPSYMKLIKTPDIVYIESGWIYFSTIRKDRELHYNIIKWSKDRANYTVIESGPVRDQEHLEELQSYDDIQEVEN